MSIEQIIALAGIVTAFVLFAAVLAWGDYTVHAMALKKKGAAAASGSIKARWPQPFDRRLQPVT